MDSRYIRKMKCTRLVLLLVFLTLLCTTDLVLAQRISKKILTEGEGKFNAPITVGKGMPFSITFNEIEIIAEVSISSTDFSSMIKASSGTIGGEPRTITLAPGTYIIKETYYGSVGAAKTLIPIPVLEIPEIVVERNLSVGVLSEYTIELSTTIYNLRAKLDGDFEGSMRIRETVGDQVVVPFKSVKKLNRGTEITYQAEFSAFAASETKISSREIVTPEVSLSLSSDNLIKINWYQISGVENYQVYRSLTPTPDFGSIDPIARAVTETTFVDASADLNTVYYYSVAAISSDGDITQTAADVPNATLWINKDGGTCEYADGTKVIFPANLVGTPENLYLASVSTISNDSVLKLESAIDEKSYVVSVSGQNPVLNFDSSARLTLKYSDKTDNEVTNPQIFALRGNKWVRLVNQTTNLHNNTVTADIKSAGIYSLASFEMNKIAENPWDINRDNSVNIFDLVLVAGQFGENGKNLKGDINGDSSVNIFDLVLVASHFGETYDSAAPTVFTSNLAPSFEVSLRAISTDKSDTMTFEVLIDGLYSLEKLAGYQVTICGLECNLRVIDAGSVFVPRSTYLVPNQRRGDQVTISAVAYGEKNSKSKIYTKEQAVLTTFQLSSGNREIKLQNALLSNVDGSSIPLIINTEIQTTLNEHLPLKTEVKQNYPNPFNPETWIPFSVASDTVVQLIVYNYNGTVIREIDLGMVSQGSYINKDEAIYWDGRNQYGEEVASGVYFYRLHSINTTPAKKMTIMK